MRRALDRIAKPLVLMSFVHLSACDGDQSKAALRDVGPLVRNHELPMRPGPDGPGDVVLMSCELNRAALVQTWPHLATWNSFSVDIDSIGSQVLLELVDARSQRPLASAQLPVPSHPTRYVVAMTAQGEDAASSARVEVYSASDPDRGIVCTLQAPLPPGSPAGLALDTWNFSSGGGALQVSQGAAPFGSISWNGPGTAHLVAQRDGSSSSFGVFVVEGMDESLIAKTTDLWPGDAYVLRVDAP